ncbi:DUF1572 family protein [Flavobacterium sp. ASW18X]|uniref:DUF1572 family protein n=1 Tax=Flavobacterium sp. ASW18X TaxID=2572595 RepID=UPI0010AE94C9|nr:DUF1572 family protein [Flavobacterium sp. ASW18X]TKD63462.1 DUF1572 domain-containing protein [Flavobacterium sp. ASW18X]
MSHEEFIHSLTFEFKRYKKLGDYTLSVLTLEELLWEPYVGTNSIAIIIKHMAGNMRSRFTNFFTEDGEKSWRNRDTEFITPPQTKEELHQLWDAGWACLFGALEMVNADNFNSLIYIRKEPHTVIAAFHRQLAHYANHIGQMVYLAKLIKKEAWISPSIAKGKTQEFNDRLMS